MTWLNDAAEEIEAREPAQLSVTAYNATPSPHWAKWQTWHKGDTASFQDWGHLDLDKQP